MTVFLDQRPPVLVQLSKGQPGNFRLPRLALCHCPPDVMLRNVTPTARFTLVLWDTDLYSALLPELGGDPVVVTS
jgi:hypothetical protein